MGTVTERRIIDLGRGSVVITLPKPWVRFHRLKPGDTLVVVTNGGLRVKVLKKKPAPPPGGSEVDGGQAES